MIQSHRVPPGKRWLRVAPSPGAIPLCAPVIDDDTLIAAVVQGDTRLAGAIHDRLVSAIEPTLLRVMGGREHDHDDLVQSTLEQIVLTFRRNRFKQGCSVSTWASAVAAHVAFNALRSRRSARRLFDPVDIVDIVDVVDAGCGRGGRMVGDAEHDMAVRARIRAAQGILAEMKPERALILIEHDVLGHEIVEIAAMQRISAAAAQSRLVRARHEFVKRAKKGDDSEGGDLA